MYPPAAKITYKSRLYTKGVNHLTSPERLETEWSSREWGSWNPGCQVINTYY